MDPFIKTTLTAFVVICAFLCYNVPVTNAKQTDIDPGLCKDAISESDCVWYIMEDIRIKLHQGIPVYGVPPLDPFFIPLIHVQTNDSSKAAIKGDFTNVTLTGLSAYVSKSIAFDERNETNFIRLLYPTLQLDGVYTLIGTVLRVFPVFGDGNFVFRLDDVGISMDLHVIKVNDKPAIDKLTANITIRDVFIYLQNIDGPFQYLVNIVLNVVAEILKLEMTPKLGHIVQDYLKAILNEYLSIVNI